MARLVHDVVDLDRALGAQNLVEIDRAKQLEGRIDDEDLLNLSGRSLSSRM
jgi:hypothetical protein